jgi:hypothetical protein
MCGFAANMLAPSVIPRFRQSAKRNEFVPALGRKPAKFFAIPAEKISTWRQGRACGVGRARGVGLGLPMGVGETVAVAVGVAVGGGVTDGVAEGIAVGVAVGVGLGVDVGFGVGVGPAATLTTPVIPKLQWTQQK